MFLITCLSDPVLTVAKVISLMADNDIITWDALQDLFKIQRLLTFVHTTFGKLISCKKSLSS